MDITTYALSKKIAAHAVSGVQSMSVSGQTLTINTKDSGVLTMTFPTPKDGVSVTDIDVNANNQIVFTMSDGSEIISGKIPTVKGDKGDPGFSPTITENADNTDKIYKLDITTADSTFTTPNLKGADGQGGTGGSGEENTIDSISVNGVNVVPDENKNVDITVPNIYVGDTEPIDDNMEVWFNPNGESSSIDVPIEKIKVNGELQIPVNKVVDITVPSIEGLAKTEDIPTKVSELTNDSGYLTEHQDISGKVDKVEGKSLIADTEIERLASVDNYDDTQIKTQIQTVANGLMDSVGYSADYKTIDIIAKNGVKKSVNVAPIISHASITELSDVDTTNKASGKALVYNATTSKHEYADVSGTDEKVKMDASTDAKYLGELLDNVTIANENGKLKVKKLDGQEVTITEINYLKGLTMNVMDLVNMFSNGGVKIINTPVATYAELLTLDKSSFIEGISYLVYVLADENHDNAKTTYLVDKDSETPTYFGFADSQRDFTTNPIDLATEITGKLGIANMDSDAIKALFTVDDTYKTETATNNAFSTHGAKALYDELLLAIGNKANDSDLTAHKDDTDIHVSTEDRTKWDSAKTHADSAHAPSNAQENVLETVKVNGTALEVSDKAVNVTVPTTVSELTDSTDYAKKTDIPTTDDTLSSTSTNPVQNKVVKAYVDKEVSENVDFSTSTSKILNGTVEAPLVLSNATRNLLIPDLQTVTANGITCTNNGDGTYTFSGTATDNVFFNINKNIPINKGTKYKVVCFKDEDYVPSKILSCVRRVDTADEYTFNNGSFVADSENCWLWVTIAKGVTVPNLVCKPMLTTDLDATYDDFVQYSGYDIKTCGKNLLNVDMPTKTQNGITCTNNGDGTYTLNGTATADTLFSLVKFLNNRSALYKKIVGKNVLFINGGHKYNSNYRILFNVSNSDYTKWGLERYDGDSFVVPSGYGIAVVDIHVNSGATVNNLVVKPMITFDLDATNDDFEPYQDGGSVHIDSSTEFPLLGLKSFDGETNIISPGNVKCVYPTNESGKGVLDSLYNKDKMLTEQNKSLVEQKMLGWTVPSECPIQNEVSGNQFIQKVGRVDLGSLNWNLREDGSFENELLTSLPVGTTPDEAKEYAIYSNLYKSSSWDVVVNSNTQDMVITLYKFYTWPYATIAIRNKKYTDANAFKQAMQGQYLYYELAAPITKTIDGNEIVETVSDVRKETTVNLLKPTLQKETASGVTCTNNGDGTYTLNGTATGYKAFVLTELHSNIGRFAGCKIVGLPSGTDVNNIDLSVSYRYENGDASHGNNLGAIVDNAKDTDKSVKVLLIVRNAQTISNMIVKPMLTTNLNATYDDFVPYTGDGETLASDVAEIKNDLGGLTFSTSGTTLTITDGTNTWTLGANS